MMMVFMERMKTGNFAEAREIATQMIYGHENFRATESKEYKSFHSLMEKELYILLESRQGSKKEVVWVEQPISDGFYLLAMLDFQEGKHEEALANMQRAVYWNPMRSAFYCERGYMLLRNNTNPNPLMAQVAYAKALELADNPEDFAGALRGLGFIFLERRQPDVALACLLLAKEFTPGEKDVEEELFFISRNFPTLYNAMDLAGARQILKRNRILDDYAPEHVQVLLRLADSYKEPKDAPRVISLLHRAKLMAPKNQEVNRRIQLLEKK
jgi:tetratricopeptide (TPR) repeat protein